MIIIAVVASPGNSETPEQSNQPTIAANSSSTTPTPAPQKSAASFGDTIVFDELEITFSSEIEFLEFENAFSEHNGETVIRFPVSIKNIKSESHGLNMFYYTAYMPDGTKANDLNAYYDDSVYAAGTMRSGATQNTYFYVVYSGDGEYVFEFSEFIGSPTEVILNIEK